MISAKQWEPVREDAKKEVAAMRETHQQRSESLDILQHCDLLTATLFLKGNTQYMNVY